MLVVSIIKMFISLCVELLKDLLRAAVVQSKNLSCKIYPGVRIDFKSKLGKHVVLFKNVVVSDSTIGDCSFVQKYTMLNKVDIGKFCSIASGVVIGPGQHPINLVSTHPAFYSATQPLRKTFSEREYFEPYERTRIGNDVWVGQNAILMDGVKVGHGAIIAAGAVVVKNVPDYAIVGGVPAQIIKYRFSEEIIEKLLQTSWWEKDEQWLVENAMQFLDVRKFVERD